MPTAQMALVGNTAMTTPFASSPPHRLSVNPCLSRRDALRLAGAAGVAFMLPRLGRAGQATTAPVGIPAAATLAGEQPGYYRFRIGAFEALALDDGGVARPPDGIWSGGSQEKLLSDLADAGMPVSRVELPFAVLLVRVGSELLLIDTGSGALFGPTAGRLPASLAAAGIPREAISAIVITHAHGDHFGGLLDPATKTPAFPNARLFISRTEYDYWTSPAPDTSEMVMTEERRARLFPKAREYLRAFDGRWIFVEPGATVIDGVEIIDAAGHTPGHIGVLFTSGSERLLHLADAVHHHAVSFANPDWIYNYDSLPRLAVETRHRLLDRAAAERLRVFGSHLPFPGLGRVRRTGLHYEHVIEPWASLGA